MRQQRNKKLGTAYVNQQLGAGIVRLSVSEQAF